MKLLCVKKLIDFFLYGNLWIGACALVMFWQTELLISGSFSRTALAGEVFFATLFLYGLHRLVGISKVKAFPEVERFAVVEKFKNHIIFYTVIGALASGRFFFQLSYEVMLALVIPALLSLGYAIPFLRGNRRLRDLHLMKIFLVAGVWAWVTVVLPIADAKVWGEAGSWLIFPERFLFVFAITMPFDIRDQKVDERSDVRTLPSVLGVKRALQLSYLSLGLSTVCVATNILLSFYSFSTGIALILSFLLAAILISQSDRMKHDYFFSGAIDGMMILQFVFIWLAK